MICLVFGARGHGVLLRWVEVVLGFLILRIGGATSFRDGCRGCSFQSFGEEFGFGFRNGDGIEKEKRGNSVENLSFPL
jgi:hypothetical protein